MVLEYHEKGKLNDEMLRSFYESLPGLEKAVKEVEQVSKIQYPPIVFDPTLNVVRFPAATFSSAVIYASTRVNMIGETYHLCVTVSLPFLLYSKPDTLRACLAHEFLHYVYLTIALESRSFMNLSSQRLDSPEVYIAFDETHVVKPEEWLNDSVLVDLVKNTFTPIISDKDLETAIRERWMDKGLPVKFITGDDSRVNIPILQVSKIPLDLRILQMASARAREGRQPKQ